MKSGKWKKPLQHLINFFHKMVPKEEGIERKKMFGYPCAFNNGYMFMGFHEESMFLRLAQEDKEEWKPRLYPFVSDLP